MQIGESIMAIYHAVIAYGIISSMTLSGNTTVKPSRVTSALLELEPFRVFFCFFLHLWCLWVEWCIIFWYIFCRPASQFITMCNVDIRCCLDNDSFVKFGFLVFVYGFMEFVGPKKYYHWWKRFIWGSVYILSRFCDKVKLYIFNPFMSTLGLLHLIHL